ncbi:MAG TPA: sensor histidine kinase [Streptosporangiaceae bacterium]|nr:sensor histidine kinase [Streptosporangiaceae bacterium]
MEEPRVPLTRRLTFANLVTIDVAAALLLAGVLAGAARTPRRVPLHLGVPVGVGIALVCAASAGVALRRWRPLTALAVALAAQAVTVFLGFTVDPMLAVAAVLYMIGLVKPARTAVGALGAVLFTLSVLALLTPAYVSGSGPGVTRVEANFGHAAGTAIVLLAAWAAGRAVRAGRAYADGLREQAERRAEAKVDQARRAVAEERLRIARELHDVVAHSMSVVAVQAGVGRYVIDSNPAEAARALDAIETTSRATLREMRQLLGMLRDGTPGEMLSAPGLADIADLAERAGLRVDVAVRGMPRELPAGVDLAAFRIVQEALTNVVKHAGTGHGRVVVTYSDEAVAIEVTDDGAGAAGSGDEGHGLIGMRERVALYGGEFSAGPLPGRGYRVSASLPIGAAA